MSRTPHKHTFWSKETPPPRAVFLFTMIPDQEPEGPPPKLINGSSGGVLFLRVLDLETTQERSILGVILPGGSSSSRFLIWKPPKLKNPREEGFLSINSLPHKQYAQSISTADMLVYRESVWYMYATHHTHTHTHTLSLKKHTLSFSISDILVV